MNGIEKNVDRWNGQPDTVDSVKADLTALENADNEIANLEQQLLQRRIAARELCQQIETKADETELRMKGIHANEREKWIEYGSEFTSPERQASVQPSMPLTLTIKDDLDAQGFIIALERKDENGEYYLFEKGMSADTKATAPTSWQPLAEIPRISTIDDNVEPGVRYFYRVRASNNKGKGPYSNVVSRVQ
ncbi:MAG: fibronectin type III domain-containing protein [Ignavibacteriae bacterium]|nr:fibronectin type III domain-containing protein [Ignavibacteriota bacterium]